MTQTVSLGDVTTYLSRGSAPKYTGSDTFYVLNQKCIRDWRVSLEPARYTDAEAQKVSEDRVLRPMDILINSTGQGTLGRVAQFYGADKPATVDSHITIVRPNPKEVDPLFLGYVLKSKEKEIEDMAEGSTGQTELSRVQLSELKLNLPPVNIQKNAAVALRDIDEKIELNRRMNETLEQMGQALFRHHFITNPEAKTWKTASLSDLGAFKNGVNYGREDEGDSDYRIVNVRDLSNEEFLTERSLDSLKMHASKANQYMLTDNDLLIVRSASPGNVGLVSSISPVIYSGFIIRFRVDDSNYRLFTFHLLKSMKHQLLGHADGTTLKNINQESLKSFKIKLPPVAMTRDFNQSVGPLVQQVFSNLEEIQTLTTLRDTLLPRLISGKVKI